MPPWVGNTTDAVVIRWRPMVSSSKTPCRVRQALEHGGPRPDRQAPVAACQLQQDAQRAATPAAGLGGGKCCAWVRKSCLEAPQHAEELRSNHGSMEIQVSLMGGLRVELTCCNGASSSSSSMTTRAHTWIHVHRHGTQQPEGAYACAHPQARRCQRRSPAISGSSTAAWTRTAAS